MNGAFLGGSGEQNRGNNYLLGNIGALKDIPVRIVHGRYDQVCPRYNADELAAALSKAGNKQVDYVVTDAGHSMSDRENCETLIAFMDNLPPMKMHAPDRQQPRKAPPGPR